MRFIRESIEQRAKMAFITFPTSDGRGIKRLSDLRPASRADDTFRSVEIKACLVPL